MELTATDPAPLEIFQHVLQNPQTYGLPSTIERATPISGGVVHHVWELASEGQKYYLKIRGQQFATLPINISPSDIQFEARAISILGSHLPDHFPQLVCCWPN